jgi:hypothetical protein
MAACDHITAITEVVPPRAYECEECVLTGDRWVHLRTCQTCGGTRCCDSSPNRHASRHAVAAGHAVAASAEPGEMWLWCYEHELFARY